MSKYTKQPIIKPPNNCMYILEMTTKNNTIKADIAKVSRKGRAITLISAQYVIEDMTL